MGEWSRASRFEWVGAEWDWQPDIQGDMIDIKAAFREVVVAVQALHGTGIPAFVSENSWGR